MYIILILGVVIVLYLSFDTKSSIKVGDTMTSSAFNELVWADDFLGEGYIDSSKWFHQTQLPPGGIWWGGLLQHYTNRDENSFVRDGYLHLVAIKEPFEDQGELKQYTSARLNSKFAFTYGRVEVRAKMPSGVGTWPAIWMLNKNINEAGAYWERQGFGETSWPYCGEIDILEHWGKEANFIQSAVHTASSYGHEVKNLGGKLARDVSNEFHLYALEWTEDKMIFSIDSEVHYIYEPFVKFKYTWPFDEDQYLLLNIAIEQDIDSGFNSSAMVVDYVRVYQ